MKINSKDFRVRSGKRVKLREWPTIIKPFCKSKKRYQELLEEHVEELSSLQQLHYASNRYALLLIFQGMDAAGKDGGVRHVSQASTSLGLASVAASTDSDRGAAQLLSNEFDNMKTLSAKLLAARKIAHFISPENFKDDPLNQNILTCARALASMAVGGEFVDDGSCH